MKQSSDSGSTTSGPNRPTRQNLVAADTRTSQTSPPASGSSQQRSGDSGIRAAPQRYHQIYVGNLMPNTRVAALRDFITEEGVADTQVVDIKPLRRRNSHVLRASFCITLNCYSSYVSLIQSSSWPDNVKVRPFMNTPPRNYRQESDSHSPHGTSRNDSHRNQDDYETDDSWQTQRRRHRFRNRSQHQWRATQQQRWRDYE